MNTSDLLVVETQGTALERARQFGEAVREPLQRMLGGDLVERVICDERRRAIADRMLAHFHAMRPPLELEEACCEAAGVEMQRLLDHRVAVAISKSRPPEGCSGVILQKDERIIVGQNLDTGPIPHGENVLEIGRGPEGGYARFCPPHILECMFGMNAHGLAHGGASGPPDNPLRGGNGVPTTLVRWRYFYRCVTPSDVAAAAGEHLVAGKGSNNVWVCPSGEMLRLEQGGGAVAMMRPEGRFAVATGHRAYLRGEDLGDRAPEAAAAERNRWLRLRELAAEALDAPGDPVAQMERMLADHQRVDDHPVSAPCRHGGERFGDTQYSVVFDVTAREVHYCGQPCRCEWRTIVL
ncbi:MAG: C45 family autoproteolytic acyltransferase/hydrolase [Armatimonadota bacterium]|nr:C45 family autoproteolytic acyltransferase/hydrolase [Armatimonadota bacterium]